MSQIITPNIYQPIILSILVCLSPSNALAYLAPFILLFWIIFIGKSKLVLRNVVIAFVFWFYLLIFYKILTPELQFGNGILSFITYGSFVPLLVIPNKYFYNKEILTKLINFITPVFIIECLLGIIQSIYGFMNSGTFDFGNGDYVEGTIHPQLISEKSMSNPIFAIIISTILIYLICNYFITRKGKKVIILGIITLVLASVMHVIISLIISFLIAWLIINPKILIKGKRIVGLVVSLIFFIGFMFFIRNVQQSNINNIFPTVMKILQNNYPKTKIMYKFYNDVSEDYPYSIILGLGPGQFISRASFMSTGQYFGGIDRPQSLTIPFTNPSDPFEDHVFDMWEHSLKSNIGNASSTQIQSSWSALITEFGLLVSVFAMILILYTIFKIRNNIKNEFDRCFAFGYTTNIFYFLFIGIQQNYWEVTQAIFIGLIFIKLIYSIIISNSIKSL